MGTVQARLLMDAFAKPKPWTWRWSRVVAQLRIVDDAAGEQALLQQLLSARTPQVLAFVNAHAMNSAAEDPVFFDALDGADVLLRDGEGMKRLYRHAGLAPGLNMNGTDFIPKLLAACAGRRVALWGTQEPHLSAASQHLQALYGVQPVSLQDGFRLPAHYLGLLAPLELDLIVLGMGMPKQEQVAQLLRAAGSRPVLIVCGGAIIDFLGGRVSRAPGWIQRLGLEWLYRLVNEPRRLFRRYVIGNPMFLWRVRQWAPQRGGQ